MKHRLKQNRYNSFLPSHLAILKTPPSYLALWVAISISFGIFIAVAWSFFGKLERVYLCSAYFNRPTLGAT
ncbi:hypothetical protein [Providencia rettgeri]|uniref:hypothetical protein n=1 Tax=Providencia rettgeri TaxID=587 RepID=UPI001FBB7E61|nr:hypothetical protein [Providencia rettgeri]